MADLETKPSKRSWGPALGVLIGGAVLIAVVVGVRSRPQTEPPAGPAPRIDPPVNAARISAEGTLTHAAPEDRFFEVAASGKPRSPIAIDRQNPKAESVRILGAYRNLAQKMKALADQYKKTDPARYAQEMEALKEELTQLLQASGAILKEWDLAGQELFAMIRDEADPVVKERLGYLLRYANPALAGPFLLSLAESSNPADRRVAITALTQLRTGEAVTALIQHGSTDADMDLRQRSIMALGRTLSQPAPPELKPFVENGWKALRSFADVTSPAPVRVAAFEAFARLPQIGEEDETLILNALRSEKDPEVLKAVRSAERHQAARRRTEADRSNFAQPANK